MRSAAASRFLNHCGETRRGAGQRGPALTPAHPKVRALSALDFRLKLSPDPAPPSPVEEESR